MKKTFWLISLLLLCSCDNTNRIFSYKVNEDGVSCTITGFAKEKYEKKYSNIEFPSSINGYTVTAIGDEAFCNNRKIETIKFSDTIVSLGKRAFMGTNCSIIGDFNNIEYFGDCCFFSTLGLKGDLLTFGQNVKYLGYGSFEKAQYKRVEYNCDPSVIQDFVNNLNHALESVKLPEGLEKLPIWFFMGCDLLKEVVLPNSLKDIGYCAFDRCKSLEELILPESLEKMDCDAIMDCDNLKKIYIPSKLTNFYEPQTGVDGEGHIVTRTVEAPLEDYISERSFTTFPNLEEIVVSDDNPLYYSKNNCMINKETQHLVLGCNKSVIPSDVKSIGTKAFYNLNANASINIPSTVERIDENAFCNKEEYTINCSVSFKPEGWNDLWASEKLTNINWGVTL